MASTFFKDGGVEKGVKGHEFGGCLLALAGCVIPKNHLHCLAVRGEFIQRRHISLSPATPQLPVIDGATTRASAVGDGATPRAAHTKHKTDREAYNSC
jgi:hypothetical protein